MWNWDAEIESLKEEIETAEEELKILREALFEPETMAHAERQTR